jgi:hypothetical protein
VFHEGKARLFLLVHREHICYYYLWNGGSRDEISGYVFNPVRGVTARSQTWGDRVKTGTGFYLIHVEVRHE